MATHENSPSDPAPSGQAPSTDPYGVTRKSGPSATPSPSPSVAPHEVVSALPSARFGKFVRVAKLGAGGMGEVWKAWDAELSRWVALKFMKIPDPEELARFKREAQVAGRLSHPNIAAVYEFGESAGTPWIAMEFVLGRTLKSFPRNDRRLLVRLIRDAARALQYAHEEGIVHRDLKPENLMVVERKKPATGRFTTGEHRVYVMDFGLARPAEGASDLSASGLVVGTPQYMSPEQARGEKVDARADVWSLGATLYELITDRKSFTGANLMEVLKAVQETEPKTPRRIDPRIDPDLETVMLKCLEKDRGRRYPSAGELAEELSRWLEGEPVTARPITGVERFGRTVRRHKALSGTVAALLVVAIGGGVALGVQRHRASTALATKDAERSSGEKRLKEDSIRREEALRELATLMSAIMEKKRDLRQLKVPANRAIEGLKETIIAVEEHIRRWPEEPQGYYVAARGWMYLGELQRAEEAIRTAVTKHPGFRPGWTLLGMVKVEQYQEERLLGTSKTLLTGPGPLLDEGQRAFERGWERGLEREESQKWGLAWTEEDAVLRRLASSLKLRHDKKTEDARRLLEEGFGEYRAEEYLVALAALSPDVDAAMRYLTEAIERAPGYAKAHFDRGSIKYAQGDFAGSTTDYDRVIELKNDSPVAYNNRGTAKQFNGDLAGAIADYDRAIELKKDFAEAYFNRGGAKEVTGDLTGAIGDYDRVIELRTDFAEAHFKRGGAKQFNGDLAGAIADYDRAIELKKDFAEAYFSRGDVKRTRGDISGAIADFDRAIEVKKDFVEAHCSRGGTKVLKGDLAGAIADYDRAVELRKDYADAYYNRGVVKQMQDDLAGAIADYDRAIKLKRDFAEAYLIRGRAKQSKGDLPGAIADFDRAIELKKDSPEAYFHRAGAKWGRDDLEGAFADYDRAIELRKDYGDAYFNRGRAKHAQGNLPGAIADWTNAFAISASPFGLNMAAWELLTCPREDLRDPQTAKAYALKAANLTGNREPVILEALALAHFRTGMVREAVDTQRKALSLLPASMPPKDRKEFEDRLKEYEAALAAQKKD